jgi:hypothetical protein
MAMSNPDAEAAFAEGLTETLSRASAEARNLFELRSAQDRENEQETGSGALPGTTGRGQSDSKHTNVRAKVPWFTGTHATYTWESFLMALEITELNTKYSDAERKQMLLQNLDGAARMFLMANRHLMHATYAEVKQAFAKRFASKKTHSLTKLRAMSMQPGEKVMLWYARILAVGDNIVAADTVGINDPTQLAAIEGQKATLDLLLTDQFKRGLRSEIRNQMKAETFTCIEDCAKAAEEAEEFLEATSVQVNHIGDVVQEAQVHYVAKTAKSDVGLVQNMNERSPVGGKSGYGKKEMSGTCYRCERPGHFTRECPEQGSGGSGHGWSRGRDRGGSHKRNSFRSRSHERTASERVADSHNLLAEQIDRLTSRLDRTGCGGNWRSHSSSRSNSRSRSASRS